VVNLATLRSGQPPSPECSRCIALHEQKLKARLFVAEDHTMTVIP